MILAIERQMTLTYDSCLQRAATSLREQAKNTGIPMRLPRRDGTVWPHVPPTHVGDFLAQLASDNCDLQGIIRHGFPFRRLGNYDWWIGPNQYLKPRLAAFQHCEIWICEHLENVIENPCEFSNGSVRILPTREGGLHAPVRSR